MSEVHGLEDIFIYILLQILVLFTVDTRLLQAARVTYSSVKTLRVLWAWCAFLLFCPLFSVDGRTAVERAKMLCLLSFELFIFRLNQMPLTCQGFGMSLFC